MGKVVSLRGARKARARAEAATTADANRAAFGRTRAERERDAADAARAARTLDGARREQ